MITLDIMFRVESEREHDFVRLYEEVYVPALRRQDGYLGSVLRRPFSQAEADEIDAVASPWTFVMELVFETEELRRRWAASDDHQVAWPQVVELSTDHAWQGHHVAAADRWVAS